MPWLSTTLIWLMARSWSAKSKSLFRRTPRIRSSVLSAPRMSLRSLLMKNSAVAIRFLSRLRMNG